VSHKHKLVYDDPRLVILNNEKIDISERKDVISEKPKQNYAEE
jgi:hypothetical protein